jgi:tripartite-type tricarboxylate transporter receptor subunit TctC
VSRAAPDGHTLMLGSNSITLGPILRAQLPYDPFRDFIPITQVAQTPNIFLVGKGLGVSNLKEFVTLAKAGQARLQYASSGRGTPSHLTVELFKSLVDVKLEEIPYKSSGQALTDTISGQVSLNAPGIAQGLPHVSGGKVVALGVTGSKRAPKAPDVPTLAEAGVPGYEAYGWHGIFAPAKLPPEILAALSKDITEALAPAEMRDRFSQQGAEVVASTSPQFAQFLRTDFDKWKTLFQKLGIKPE